MPTLATELRNQLERVIIQARDVAEAGARAALEALAVHHYEPYGHMTPENRQLRNHLRARGRQLGDRQDRSGRLVINHLIGECAYEHWHRMLFARFLAENGLLIEPEMGVAMSLAEAEELAKDEGVDMWVFASRCAQRMFPQIFRPDDPLLQVAFATEHMVELKQLLDSLPPALFTASDALGWVYQFWQSKRKDEVNRSEVKVGADEISAVTQLFTEPYMVEFLLHNTLGAWWAGNQLSQTDAAQAESEDELRHKLVLPGVSWDYLRFVRGEDEKDGPWRPASGTFDGWPKQAKDIKVLDPCCGSGHFLVAAMHHLVPIRLAEEGLSAAEAVEAVLRDNLHGLEIDERCCQIAAFVLALAAWTYPDAGGYREFPELHIACTGIGPRCSAEEWVRLAEESGVPMPTVGREAIKNGLLNLHRLFSQAPTLGSLINPAELPADLIAADYETIQPYLTAIRSVEQADDEVRERAVAAAGMVKAADLLAGEYTLVITNVPYLKREKFCESLHDYCDGQFPRSKGDLATVCVERCGDFCANGGCYATVAPQSWLYLQAFADFRTRILRDHSARSIAKLGPGAFGAISGEVVNVVLSIFTTDLPMGDAATIFLDATGASGPTAKSESLGNDATDGILQRQLRENPDSRIVITNRRGLPLLSEYADALEGLSTGDLNWTSRKFWELAILTAEWTWFQGTVKETCCYGGRERILLWCDGGGPLAQIPGARVIGRGGWEQIGVAVSQMHRLGATFFTGEKFDDGTAAVVLNDAANLPALWAFCSSEDFREKVREIDESLKVTSKSLIKVPFDLKHWQAVAAEQYPDGLPEPESDDPTQWLFHGRPDKAQEGTELQVAVVRLLGYRWPAELDPDMRLSDRARGLANACEELVKFADKDGIVCIPAVRGEEPAAERLLWLLTACDIGPDVNLNDWLRSHFLQQHCELFHHRPFVWHIWDGRKHDGFHALVNSHKLCEGGGKGRKLLESLTYSYLGDWINRCKDEVKRGEGGAEDRVAAAVALQDRLKSIIAGEPPFDIFVRWKPLHEQPVGWEPDINDGVRMNIRPFMSSDLPKPVCPGARKGAGVLRYKPNIKWTKDRGKEPERPKAEYPWFWGWDGKTEDFMGGKSFDGVRHNACHYTTKAKQAAREAVGKDKP